MKNLSVAFLLNEIVIGKRLDYMDSKEIDVQKFLLTVMNCCGVEVESDLFQITAKVASIKDESKMEMLKKYYDVFDYSKIKELIIDEHFIHITDNYELGSFLIGLSMGEPFSMISADVRNASLLEHLASCDNLIENTDLSDDLKYTAEEYFKRIRMEGLNNFKLLQSMVEKTLTIARNKL